MRIICHNSLHLCDREHPLDSHCSIRCHGVLSLSVCILLGVNASSKCSDWTVTYERSRPNDTPPSLHLNFFVSGCLVTCNGSALQNQDVLNCQSEWLLWWISLWKKYLDIKDALVRHQGDSCHYNWWHGKSVHDLTSALDQLSVRQRTGSKKIQNLKFQLRIPLLEVFLIIDAWVFKWGNHLDEVRIYISNI